MYVQYLFGIVYVVYVFWPNLSQMYSNVQISSSTTKYWDERIHAVQKKRQIVMDVSGCGVWSSACAPLTMSSSP